MFCNKCGKSISEGVKFCPYCGEEIKIQLLKDVKNDINKDKYRSKKLKYLFIFLGVIIGAAVSVLIANRIYIYSIPELENIQSIETLIEDYETIENNNTSEYKTDENMLEKLKKYDKLAEVDGLRYAVNENSAILVPCEEFMKSDNLDMDDTDVFKFNKNMSEVKIPKKLRYKDQIIEVIEIADYAFQNSVDIIEIKVPDTVKKIGKNAFKNCILLESINIPNQVNKINDFTFMGCYSLSEIIIPDSVRKIGNAAFLGCKSLDNLKLPEDMLDIGEFAFSYCPGLTDIKIPDGIKTIREGTFADCYSLKNVKYPADLEKIEKYAFWQCSSLSEVDIPEGTEDIEGSVFFGCYSIDKVSIPSTVKTIGSCVFQNCDGLSEIEIPNHLAQKDNYGIWRLNTRAKVNII